MSTVATERRAVQLEVFSDVICPWCYIGKTKLRPALEQYAAEGGRVEVRLRPFQLHPDFTGPSRPLSQYLAQRFGPRAAEMSQTVAAAGAELGLALELGSAIAASTLLAHQLIEAAWDHGGYQLQQAVAEELFASHFSRGEDVADPEILRAAGRRADVPDAVIEAAFSDPVYPAKVRASLAEAQQLGITAVPTFVADRSIGLQGAQPSETLLALLRKAAE